MIYSLLPNLVPCPSASTHWRFMDSPPKQVPAPRPLLLEVNFSVAAAPMRTCLSCLGAHAPARLYPSNLPFSRHLLLTILLPHHVDAPLIWFVLLTYMPHLARFLSYPLASEHIGAQLPLSSILTDHTQPDQLPGRKRTQRPLRHQIRDRRSGYVTCCSFSQLQCAPVNAVTAICIVAAAIWLPTGALGHHLRSSSSLTCYRVRDGWPSEAACAEGEAAAASCPLI
jgi:hypothetical protein